MDRGFKLTADPRPPLDGKEFNDPTAWGYCRWCAFDVAVYMGAMVEHRRYRNGSNDSVCTGSGREPAPVSPTEAKAAMTVSLFKSADQTRRRAYWARQRQTARRMAADRLRAKMGSPTRVTVTSMATGEEVDITDAIIGPVHLDYDPFELEEDDDGEERDRP
jgi:hypothetical protein